MKAIKNIQMMRKEVDQEGICSENRKQVQEKTLMKRNRKEQIEGEKKNIVERRYRVKLKTKIK